MAQEQLQKHRGPDGRIHVFPSNATDAEIQAALDSMGDKPSVMSPKPSILDTVLDLLPAAGGTVGGIIGGAGGTAFGMGFGGVPGAVGGAAFGGATGEAVRQLSDRVRGIQAPKTPLAAIKEIATDGAVQGALEATGAAASKYVVKPVARAVMRGYLKPSLAGVKIDKAREIVQTALDEALPVTQGGERRADRLIAEINTEVGGLLQGVRGKVNLKQVADRVRAFAKAKYYKPGVSNADYNAALEVADLIDNHGSLSLPNGARVTQLNAAKANEVKTAVRPNSRAYGQQGAAPEADARKAAGHEMRTAIEDTAKKEGVDIGPRNERERKLIDAQDAIKRAAGREENKGLHPAAMPNLLAGMIGSEEYARTHDPASSIAWAMATRAAMSPAIATRIAIKASQLAKNGYAPAAAARMALEFYRSEAKQETQRNPDRP
jgi:hypothetical protein